VNELFVVIGLIGVIMAISTPFLLSFIRTSALRAGAEEMATVLNRARQLAIKDNRSICVTNNGSRVQYRIATCGGTIWTGPGTDSNGFVRLANNIDVTAGQVTFTYIGTAPLGGSYTVSSPHDASTLSVVVVPSGRIAITP
jgi:Tfp pilus assembly protein FimT